MKIGLIDVDSHNFPNLALMKLSAYHKDKGDKVEWVNYWDNYNIVYKSKVFTFSNEDRTIINSDVIINGGSGYDLENNLRQDIESTFPDYSLYPQYDYAVGFLTRGCSRNCPFCIVYKKEGASHKVGDLGMFWNGQKEIKLLDPNILECDKRESLLSQLKESGALIDFTQGLDIRFINNEIINQLQYLNIKRIHFAYDLTDNSKVIEKNLMLFRDKTNYKRDKVSVYILVNYNTTIEEDIYRIEFVKSLGFSPFVMVYDKHKINNNTVYMQLQRWVNSPRLFWSCSFKSYVDEYIKTHRNYIKTLLTNHSEKEMKTLGLMI